MIIEFKLKPGKIIPATYDPVFKALLTADECREYLADLIHLVTKIPKDEIMENMEIKNSEHMKSHIREKGKVSDLIVDVDNNRINLECNMEYYDGLFSKNNAYQHKLAAEQLLVGENWVDEKKIIQINFDMFTKFDERTIIKFMIMDEERHIVETKNFEKYHVNLDLIRKLYYNDNKKLSNEQKRLLLLAVDDKKDIEKIVKGDDTMEKAKNKLVGLSEDTELVGMYEKELMEKKIRNTMIRSAEIDAEKRGLARGMEKGLERGIKEGLAQGIEKGIEQGIEKGIEQGIERSKKNIVMNMIKKNMDIDTIAEITELSRENIESYISSSKDN
ncbi:MAG: hypothetical protein E7166_02340 [Firmicutes bacterium]|nr:hypothetical protein [Bacillota bacterium]